MKTRGKGSIAQLEPNKEKRRCRKWQLRISLGRDPASPGTYRRKTRVFHGTYSEAQKALASLIDQYEKGDYYEGDRNVTVGEYIKRWEKIRSNVGLARRTLENEKSRLANVTLNIGNMFLKDVRAEHIEKLYSDLAKGHTKSGKPLAPKSIEGVHKSLTTMLMNAYKEGIISRRVIENIHAPKAETRTKKDLTSEQILNLISELDPLHHFELALLICLTTGLRRSEALAIKWIDIDDGALFVNRALEEDGTEKATKNRASTNVVPMPTTLQESLHKVEQYQRELGIYHKQGYVVTMDGNVLKPHSFTRWLSRNAERLGIKGYTIHEMRHSYLTELARKGVHPRVMQELARHSSMKTTMEIYSHVNYQDKQEAVSRLDF